MRIGNRLIVSGYRLELIHIELIRIHDLAAAATVKSHQKILSRCAAVHILPQLKGSFLVFIEVIIADVSELTAGVFLDPAADVDQCRIVSG